MNMRGMFLRLFLIDHHHRSSMDTKTNTEQITVSARIAATIEKVWHHWTDPAHIVNWNAASDDWHCPRAENDLRKGGRFAARMEPRDSNDGFDFGGEYLEVVPMKKLVYTMDDGRRCEVVFMPDRAGTLITETFDAEGTHSVAMQRTGWQAILDRFKSYVEGK